GTRDCVGDVFRAEQPRRATRAGVFERPRRTRYLDAGFDVLGAAIGHAPAAVEEITAADRESAGHQQARFGQAVAVDFTRPPRAGENRFAFLVDLPTHLAEDIDAVGALIDGEPVERALCQEAIDI